LVALLLSCAEPVPAIPEAPLGPDTLGQRETGRFSFYSMPERTERVRYLAYWGDNVVDSSDYLRAGDTVQLTHAWSDTGTFLILCRAQTEGGILSGFSPGLTVVIRNYPPAVPAAILGPDTVRADSFAEFRTATTDPETDLITYLFAWGDGDTVTAPGYASGDTARMLHAWSDTGAYQIRVMARDPAGHESGWSSPRLVTVVP
jgi:hypothetical protein